MKTKGIIKELVPIFLAFFVMGFVDIVGVSTSFVKNDFGLNNTLANMLPVMVFVWFAVCSLPTGVFMGYIGRRRTVLLSLGLTTISMLLPLIYYSFPTILFAFMLLGISNTVLQVSLNPLLLDVVTKNKVTSTLTLGMFIKAISSTLGPIIVSAAVGLGGYWSLAFIAYAIISFLSCLWLALTPIKEVSTTDRQQPKFSDIFILFKDHKLLVSFSIIALSVGFEISLMTAVPKYFAEQCNMPLEKGSLGCSVYFAARTLGTLLGSIVLTRFSAIKFLIGNLVLAIVTFITFILTSNVEVLFVTLFLIGFTCANIFPIVYSQALQSNPNKANEISAMMIMGVAGGAILPVIMGLLTDLSNQWGGLFVPFAALVYILVALIKK
ncbi:MFS transporter [Bacteroides nordii]|uniref:MFS transporter n=1 Tax=Bacteroides nordii TaxID=291645 RepID=UPI00399ADF7A